MNASRRQQGRRLPDAFPWLVLEACTVAALLAASRGGGFQVVLRPDAACEAVAEARRLAGRPIIVAVMPFENQTEERDAADRVRKGFYNFFSSLSCADVEPALVDEELARLERSAGTNAASVKPMRGDTSLELP